MKQPDILRLKHIMDYCEEIAATIKRYGNSAEIFDEDIDFQKSVSFSIMQIGELATKLSDEARMESSSDIPWQQIRGMRNLFAHDYGSMSRETIWVTATRDIPILLEMCRKYVD